MTLEHTVGWILFAAIVLYAIWAFVERMGVAY